jgi:hypothetical protein
MVTAGEEIPSGCGVNFLAPFIESLTTVTEASRHSGIIEYFYAWPDPTLVACAHDGGALVGWQVGSGEEAAAAEAVGCDFVIAQGTEAGGHVRGRLALEVVLAGVLSRVAVPVVAAGGIGTPERVAELLARGADAVRVGTCFLACPEAQAHPEYVANLLGAAGDDTVITEWFDDDDGWPNAPPGVARRPPSSAAQRMALDETAEPRRQPTDIRHGPVRRNRGRGAYCIESAERVLRLVGGS